MQMIKNQTHKRHHSSRNVKILVIDYLSQLISVVSVDTCLNYDMQGNVPIKPGPYSYSEHLPSEPQGMSACGFHVQTGEISGQEKRKNV